MNFYYLFFNFCNNCCCNVYKLVWCNLCGVLFFGKIIFDNVVWWDLGECNIKICWFSCNVFCGLWVMSSIDLFLSSLKVKFWSWWWLMVLRVEKGLLSKIKFVFCIKVCVKVICCFCLFESCE